VWRNLSQQGIISELELEDVVGTMVPDVPWFFADRLVIKYIETIRFKNNALFPIAWDKYVDIMIIKVNNLEINI
jgi:hypothetical protein